MRRTPVSEKRVAGRYSDMDALPTPTSAVPLNSRLSDQLLRAFDRRGTDEQLTILSRGKVEWFFDGAGLGSIVKAKARALRDWLGPGPHILVLALPAGETFLTTLLACLVAEIGVVPVPLPRRGSASGRFAHVTRDCGASAILCLAESTALLREALEQGSDSSVAPPVVALPLDPADLPDRVAPSRLVDRDVAVIQYTSGSTHLPKGVCITGRNILANCDLVMRNWGMDGETRTVSWLPHYHDMGLMGGILYPILCGGCSCQMSPWDFIRHPLAWLRAISEWRASFSGAPAFAFADVIRRVPEEDLAGLDLSCWKRAFCGAEPVPSHLLDDFHSHLAPTGLRRSSVFACYGLAEMTLFAAGIPGDTMSGLEATPDVTAGCVLNAETRAGLCIVDPETHARVPDGRTGEIWLKGPSQGSGYLNLPEETDRHFGQQLRGERSAGWLRTGDLGRVHEGRLFVNGRMKDVLVCRGHKISAPEVEWLACAAHPALDPLAAAAFMPDPNLSGRAALVAETYVGPTDDEDSVRLKETIRRSVLGEWGLDLAEILFVPRGALSRTTSGKIRRQAVAQQYRDGLFARTPPDEASACP